MSKHRGESKMTLEEARAILAPLGMTITKEPALGPGLFRYRIDGHKGGGTFYGRDVEEAVGTVYRPLVVSLENKCRRGHHWVGENPWCPTCDGPTII